MFFPGKGLGLGFSFSLPGPWPLDRKGVAEGVAEFVCHKTQMCFELLCSESV